MTVSPPAPAYPPKSLGNTNEEKQFFKNLVDSLYSIWVEVDNNAMPTVYKQLAQARPSSTSPVSIFTPQEKTQALIRSIRVTNTSGGAATFSIYHDDDGTTYDESTAIAWNESILADESKTLDFNINTDSIMANIAVQTDTADALTFTVYGGIRK